MKSIFYFISKAIFFTFISITSTTARSFLHVIDDSLNNIGMVTQPDRHSVAHNNYFNSKRKRNFNIDADKVFSSRTKRAADGCPVHPDTPVILDGKETYFDFDVNDPKPAALPEENEDISCPAQHGDWWPGKTKNLKASCPWSWETFDTWTLRKGLEIYPRYVTQVKCLCETCVNARGMGCNHQRRILQFYRKQGCQGNKPVFDGGKVAIPVGCYCARD